MPARSALAARAFAKVNNAALCRIPQGANALGLARFGVLPTSRDAQAMLADARSAYVIYGIEPGLDFADQAAAVKRSGSAQVVAFSHFACESTRRVADVILPIGALPEIDATLTNLEGRDQVAVPAGKLPDEARAGWRVLRALGAELAAARIRVHRPGRVARWRHAAHGRCSRCRCDKHRRGRSRNHRLAGDLPQRCRRAPRCRAAGASADARCAGRAASRMTRNPPACMPTRWPRSATPAAPRRCRSRSATRSRRAARGSNRVTAPPRHCCPAGWRSVAHDPSIRSATGCCPSARSARSSGSCLKILAIAVPVILDRRVLRRVGTQADRLDARAPRADVHRQGHPPGLRRRVQAAVQGSGAAERRATVPVPPRAADHAGAGVRRVGGGAVRRASWCCRMPMPACCTCWR